MTSRWPFPKWRGGLSRRSRNICRQSKCDRCYANATEARRWDDAITQSCFCLRGSVCGRVKSSGSTSKILTGKPQQSRCAVKARNGRSCRCHQMSREPLHIICAMIGPDAPVGVCSSATMLPSLASTAALPSQKSCNVPCQKQGSRRLERGRTCCVTVWRRTCCTRGHRSMRLEKCFATKAPIRRQSMPRLISTHCGHWPYRGREVPDETVASGR